MNIAFGDYSGGVAGHEATDQIIREGIEAIHEKVHMPQNFKSKLGLKLSSN